MISQDDELQVAAKLRSDIVYLVGAIRDSSQGWMRFNDPSPNWLTSGRLKNCLDEYEQSLIRIGALRVHLHGPCGSHKHEELASHVYGHGGYWRYELDGGLSDADLAADGCIVVNGRPMETVFDDALASQTGSTRPCPCMLGETAAEHTVSEYFLWPRRNESRLVELVELTLTLKRAIDKSEDRKRRSGIREFLLQALIKLDDMILEENSEGVLLRRGIEIC